MSAYPEHLMRVLAVILVFLPFCSHPSFGSSDRMIVSEQASSRRDQPEARSTPRPPVGTTGIGWGAIGKPPAAKERSIILEAPAQDRSLQTR